MLIGPVGEGGGTGRWLVYYIGRVRKHGPPMLTYPRLGLIPALEEAGLLERLSDVELTDLREFVEVRCVSRSSLYVVFFDACYDIRQCNVDLSHIWKHNHMCSMPQSPQSASRAAHLRPLSFWAGLLDAWCTTTTTIKWSVWVALPDAVLNEL